MALLRPPPPAPLFHVPARCLLGRSRACDLVLADRDVSSQHALLRWTGERWELQDLGSRNGTFVDEVRLAPAARVVVAVGARLRFGRAAAVELLDAGGPRLLAVHARTGEVRLAEGGYLALAADDAPPLAVFQESGGAWVCEGGGETTAFEDRAAVQVGDDLWRIHLPSGALGTWGDEEGEALVRDLRLRLAFTRDEEYVEAVAFAGERRLDLQVRAHHYLLLVLARRRLAHRAAGVPEPEAGWARQDELQRMLKMDENHLNTSIHRARAQLGKLGVADAASLIERRPGTRQIRLGVAELALVPLDEPTAAR